MRAAILFPIVSMMMTAQQPLLVDAPIQRVRIHPDEAWITRVGRVHLPASGTHRVQIQSLPSGLRIDDLQVSLRGTAGLRLGDVSVSSDVRVVTETSEWKKLEAERESLRDKRDLLEAQGEAAQQELTFLKGLEAEHDKELSSRLAYSLPNPAGVLELGKGLQSRMAELLTGERRRKRELEKLAAEESKINAEFNKRSSEKKTAPSRVTIEIQASQESNSEVEVSYRNRSARWRPLYEARLSEDRKKMDLVLYASVAQNTGESWDGVRMEISNARPSRELSVPVFMTGKALGWMGLVAGKVPTSYSAEELMRLPTSNNYSGALSLAPGVTGAGTGAQLFRVDGVGIADTEAIQPQATMIEEATGLAATFLLEGMKDVPSDNESHRFLVRSVNLEPRLTVFCTPRLDPTAFLLARFSAPSGLPLFPGSPVARFAGNQRLGESPLNVPASGQPFSLGFGPYKSVRVNLRRVDQKIEQTGTFTKEKLWTLREAIDVENDGNEALDIEVQDRMLTSNTDQVKVALMPEFTPGWTEAIPGVRTWKLKLDAKAHQKIDLSMNIRAPREGHVTGLEELNLPE